MLCKFKTRTLSRKHIQSSKTGFGVVYAIYTHFLNKSHQYFTSDVYNLCTKFECKCHGVLEFFLTIPAHVYKCLLIEFVIKSTFRNVSTCYIILQLKADAETKKLPVRDLATALRSNSRLLPLKSVAAGPETL